VALQPLTRRSLLSGSAVTAVAAIAGYVVARNSSAASATASTTRANGYGVGTASTVLTQLSTLTGDGVVSHGVVLTRSGGGAVHAVSATCTHQGCTVGSPRHGVVTCPCHGSQFDAATGKVLRGPATEPLPTVAVRVQGDSVVRG
jgi:Rieske Fe-S protein